MTEEQNVDTMYSVYTWSVLPFWILIILFPSWKVTNIMMRSKIMPACYAIIYAVNMLLSQYRSVGTPSCSGCDGDKATDNLISSLTNKYTLTGAWVHYLVFDFFAGCWEVTDARKKGIPHILVVPCCLLTLFLGPVGFLVYWIIRLFFTRKIEEEVEHSDVEYTKNRWIFTLKPKYELTRFLMIWFGTKTFWLDFFNLRKWWREMLEDLHLIKKKEEDKDTTEDEEEDDEDETKNEKDSEEEEEEEKGINKNNTDYNALSIYNQVSLDDDDGDDDERNMMDVNNPVENKEEITTTTDISTTQNTTSSDD